LAAEQAARMWSPRSEQCASRRRPQRASVDSDQACQHLAGRDDHLL